MLLFFIDLINIENLKILFHLFYSLSFLILFRAISHPPPPPPPHVMHVLTDSVVSSTGGLGRYCSNGGAPHSNPPFRALSVLFVNFV